MKKDHVTGIYPPLTSIRDVSFEIAVAVAEKFYTWWQCQTQWARWFEKGN